MNSTEALRGMIVTKSRDQFGLSWPDRKKVLLAPFGNSSTAKPSVVLGLGICLSDAFRLPTFRGQRGQSGTSRAGSAWPNLVTYYLNLCFAGTDTLAMTKSWVPECLKDALAVTHAGSATSVQSDIDVMVIHAPGFGSIQVKKQTKGHLRTAFDAYATTNFSTLSTILIQTKTTWNDTAQTPMLWNMIYNLAANGQMPRGGPAIGSGSSHLNQLRSFAYAFVTVPTQSDLSQFRPNSMPVMRVAGLSGGAYWGRPTRAGVISSLTEFFNKAYNQSNHQFPQPGIIGKGYADEINASSRPGAVDVRAFDLLQ